MQRKNKNISCKEKLKEVINFLERYWKHIIHGITKQNKKRLQHILNVVSLQEPNEPKT